MKAAGVCNGAEGFPGILLSFPHRGRSCQGVPVGTQVCQTRGQGDAGKMFAVIVYVVILGFCVSLSFCIFFAVLWSSPRAVFICTQLFIHCFCCVLWGVSIGTSWSAILLTSPNFFLSG